MTIKQRLFCSCSLRPILLILGAGLLLVSFYIAFWRDDQPVVQREPVTFGIALQPSSALVLIAKDKGFFSKNGLDVTIHTYPSGKRAMHEGLFARNVELISVTAVPVTFAGFKRDDFRIVASLFSANNINRIVARHDRGITQREDLRGKHIATQQASAVHFFLHLFLLDSNISEQDVQLSYMKAELLPQALQDGSIDAFSMREPYISRAKDLLGDNAIVFSAPGVYEQVELLLASAKLVKQRPIVVQRILQSLLDAEAYVSSRLGEASIIVASNLNAPEAEIRKILPGLNLRVSMEQELLLLLEEQARWAIKQSLIEEQEVPDYLGVFHPESLMKLRRDKVTLFR